MKLTLTVTNAGEDPHSKTVEYEIGEDLRNLPPVEFHHKWMIIAVGDLQKWVTHFPVIVPKQT